MIFLVMEKVVEVSQIQVRNQELLDLGSNCNKLLSASDFLVAIIEIGKLGDGVDKSPGLYVQTIKLPNFTGKPLFKLYTVITVIKILIS